MKAEKIVFLAFVFIFTFSCIEISAQNLKSAQTNSSVNGKYSPFKEAETIIAEVEFTGLDGDYEEYNGVVYQSDFMRNLRGNRAMISAGEKFNSRKIERIITLLKEWLAGKGFLKADVVALGVKLPENKMKLVFSVSRNEPVRVSKIRFVGNKNISNEEFAADFKEHSGENWEIFEKRKYDYFAQKYARELMFSKGYFEGRINRITPRIIDGSYVVTIEVNEGVRYRIGEIKIDGAKVFSEKDLLDIFGQNEGDVADGKLVQEFFNEKLKRIYADKGYVLYDAEFDVEFTKPQVEGLDGIVNIKATIDEGEVFKAAKIEFVGVEKEKAQQLKENFPLKEGEIYNQNKFEDGIKKMNETKKFYKIDKDSDSEISTDDESNGICIKIKVREIPK